MSNRITMKDLRPVLARVVRETGAPQGALWIRTGSRNVALVGALFIEQGSTTYGRAWTLSRMANASGGQSDVLRGRTAADLYHALHAYLQGWSDAKRAAIAKATGVQS